MNEERIKDESSVEEATIVSFDIPQDKKAKRVMLQRFIYGRTETKKVNGRTRTYKYPGLLDEGGFRLGQSVFIFPPDLASRLIARLQELDISHRYWEGFLVG